MLLLLQWYSHTSEHNERSNARPDVYCHQAWTLVCLGRICHWTVYLLTASSTRTSCSRQWRFLKIISHWTWKAAPSLKGEHERLLNQYVLWPGILAMRCLLEASPGRLSGEQGWVYAYSAQWPNLYSPGYKTTRWTGLVCEDGIRDNWDNGWIVWFCGNIVPWRKVEGNRDRGQIMKLINLKCYWNQLIPSQAP